MLFFFFFFFFSWDVDAGGLFNVARNILVQFPSCFFSIHFVCVRMVHPYSSIDTTATRRKLCFSDGSLKLVDKFSDLGSSVSSNESDINMGLAKAWTAIDRLIDHMEV